MTRMGLAKAGTAGGVVRASSVEDTQRFTKKE
ncbi:hypothetical protein CDEF62S_04511 [Castellaniella defragrans]